MPGRHRAPRPSPRRLIIPLPWPDLGPGLRTLGADAARAVADSVSRRARRRWHPATLLVVPLLPLLAFAVSGEAAPGPAYQAQLEGGPDPASSTSWPTSWPGAWPAPPPAVLPSVSPSGRRPDGAVGAGAGAEVLRRLPTVTVTVRETVRITVTPEAALAGARHPG